MLVVAAKSGSACELFRASQSARHDMFVGVDMPLGQLFAVSGGHDHQVAGVIEHVAHLMVHLMRNSVRLVHR